MAFGAALVLMAFSATYFISPIAEALNTHSIDLESGSSQYLSASDSNSLDLSDTLSLEAWVKFESINAGDTNPFIFKRNPTGNQRSYNFHLSGASSLSFESYTDGSAAGCGVSVSWSPSTATWYHVAVTKSGTSVKFYVNGSQQGSTQTCSNGSIFNSTATLEIGSFLASPVYLDGLIDDVRVWNAERTAQEIADDYDTELNGNETGLVGYWKLSDSLSDSTANGNTLTNNNSAIFSSDVGFGGFVQDLTNRKSSNESVISSTVLQDDDELTLSLAANKTYVIDGVIFASSTSGTPDIKIGFTGQTGVDIRLGYTTDNQNEVLIGSGSSAGIPLQANTPRAIHVAGTVTTSSTSGDFKLKWAQNSSNVAATTVMKGSYLRAQEM